MGGRKSARDERLRNRVIEKAWKMKETKMTENDATAIVVKDMATKVQGSGDNGEIVIKISKEIAEKHETPSIAINRGEGQDEI